ncbi:MAG: S8 family serine peptidase [Bacteroidales bacterium]|nr:S8 family serine peptidase [Bacteroidales bacterium]
MKHFLHLMVLSLLCCLSWSAAAQMSNPFVVATNNEDEVMHLDSRQQHAAKPNQLLVKFHDYSDIRIDNAKGGKCFMSSTKGLLINSVLKGYSVESIEQLMPNFVMPKAPRVSKSYGGGDVEEHDLSQWHLITLDTKDGKNEYELMEELRTLDEVEYVEPNYICYALGAIGERDLVMDSPADATAVSTPKVKTALAKSVPNDPMYSLQWGIPACGIDSLLTAPKLNPSWRPIIAIIDTGVDIDHADLQGNIWTNVAEAGGATNQDDDHNGFRDDIHGWDFVNQTADIHDFNSHGTHCAGIAGAVINNGIGIAGACPDALIMPVCVMQSDGTGDIATIIQGINYARQNGADVISMSIGTYAYSIAMEQALSVAYQTAVIVAAAGNDTKHIDVRCCTKKEPQCGPVFPGALTFVLGVQATNTIPDPSEEHNGMLASFSNIDCDGPSYSQYNESQLYNYELSAPGVGIMSTVLNGQYRSYNGTSMATPLVAGGVASLLQRRDYLTKEILFGDLINYSTEFHPVNFWAAYNAESVAPAVFQCVAIEINDSAYGDSSMYADAGERVQLYPTIRTVWGPADSIVVWLEFQEYEDTNTIQILQNRVNFVWPLSSYAHSKSLNPIDIRIGNNVVDGRKIRLNLCAYSTDASDTLHHPFTLQVTNGVKLHGMINHNDTLYPNVQYIVTQNLALPTGCTLYIKPGTTIKMKDGCSINATIQAIGKPDSMITFTKTDLGTSWSRLTSPGGLFDYCVFEYNNTGINIAGVNRMPLNVSNSIFRYKQASNPNGSFQYVEFVKANLLYNKFWFANCVSNQIQMYGAKGSYCNVIGNDPLNAESRVVAGNSIGSFNNIFCNNSQAIRYESSGVDITTPDTNYYGSAKESIIRDREIYDFETPGTSSFGWINLSKRATRPSPLTHGIVWKVLVNGFDPQDEADSVEYLGVGTHRFDVYFNRAMDTSITPILAMGVRPPYTQTAINKNASWSADSTIYTAFLTLTGRDAIDGVNRIYVSGAQDDEHFEIPFENQRFEVQVASSGSMSMGFQATPGIGKVDLEWNDQEVNYEDFLGFNIYRYQYDSLLTNRHYVSGIGYIYDTVWMPVDTIRLNQSLVQDTMFTDFDVVPGERYYYYYKILNTSLNENSPSKTVSCVPYSTIPGDANGSFTVDVADVITAVNYVTGQNPQPFLFDAADVNGDGTINVLDIVGIINIILYGNNNSKNDYDPQTAIYTVENDTLYINTPVALAGLQFTIGGCSRGDIEVLTALKPFECATVEDSNTMTMIFYSMSGMTIPAGKTALLRIGDKKLDNIVLSDPEGHNVIALNGGEVGVTDLNTMPAQIVKAYPNPFDNRVRIEAVSAVSGKPLRISIYDITGRLVHNSMIPISPTGQGSYEWDAKGMPRGVYMARLYVGDMAAHVIKLVIK